MNQYIGIFLIIALVLLVVLIVVIVLVSKQKNQPSLVGKDELIGQEGIAKTDLNPGGEIMVEGELWQAKSISGEIKKGQEVKVVGMKKFTLEVEKIKKEE